MSTKDTSKNMENQIENLDSPNEEETVDSENDVNKEEEPEFSDREKKLFARTKKSEGEIKVLKEQLKKFQPSDSDKSQSNEPDYAKIAFLETKGFSNPDDQKWIQDEAGRLKLPLTDIINMEHAKLKLATMKDEREAQAGMPKGPGRGSGKTQQDVDYWLAKGETPDDQELGAKVIEARIKKEKDSNKFSEQLFTG